MALPFRSRQHPEPPAQSVSPVLSTHTFTPERYAQVLADNAAEPDLRRVQLLRRTAFGLLVLAALGLTAGVVMGVGIGPLSADLDVATDQAKTMVTAMMLGILSVTLGPIGYVACSDSATRASLRAHQHAAELSAQQRDALRDAAGPDPLGWPAWLLDPKYAALHPDVVAAVSPHLTPNQLKALLGRAHHGGLVGEQLALVQELPMPRVETVTLAHHASAPPPAHSTLPELRARHHQLSVEYGEYLTDPRRVLELPVLNDVTDSRTAEFVEAYAALTALPVDSDIDPVRYEELLTRAWQSWRTAHAHAKRTKLKNFTSADRKRLVRARQLLELTLDPNTSSFERASARTQLARTIDGLVDLPAEAVAEIDAVVRPALERAH